MWSLPTARWRPQELQYWDGRLLTLPGAPSFRKSAEGMGERLPCGSV